MHVHFHSTCLGFNLSFFYGLSIIHCLSFLSSLWSSPFVFVTNSGSLPLSLSFTPGSAHVGLKCHGNSPKQSQKPKACNSNRLAVKLAGPIMLVLQAVFPLPLLIQSSISTKKHTINYVEEERFRNLSWKMSCFIQKSSHVVSGNRCCSVIEFTVVPKYILKLLR